MCAQLFGDAAQYVRNRTAQFVGINNIVCQFSPGDAEKL